jgi:hypothetical protein
MLRPETSSNDGDRSMNFRSAWSIFALVIAIGTPAKSGHESPIYPSFYPHEIEIIAMAADRAADLLLTGKIQAYVGNAPRFVTTPPDSIDNAGSLGSFVIVRVNPTSARAKDGRSACAIAEAVIRDLAGKGGDMIVHPYPVTPFNGDYLHYVDLAETAKARILGGGAGRLDSDLQLKVRAGSAFAKSLVRAAWRSEDSDWDAEIVELGAADLIAPASIAINGWSGPAWLRTGWYQTYLLLGELIGNEDLSQRVEPQLQRLKTATYNNAVEHINLERTLVSTLADGCYARVAGYTVKREYFSTVFTAGIENISYDAVTGFNSPMFIRTVKLKDFPWNGWLVLGIDAAPKAAWNPIAGFSDNFGRLMWSAVGDPALIPSPNEQAWMLNRISDVQSSGAK